MILAASGGSVLINQNKISKEVFEETLERIFKIKSKMGKNQLRNIRSHEQEYGKIIIKIKI